MNKPTSPDGQQGTWMPPKEQISGGPNPLLMEQQEILLNISSAIPMCSQSENCCVQIVFLKFRQQNHLEDLLKHRWLSPLLLPTHLCF